MPDLEKAIQGIEICVRPHSDCNACPYNESDDLKCIENLRRDVIELLKAQKPVKPVVNARDGWYRCGNCNSSLASGERVKSFGTYKWPVYCEMCGRAVKWDG